VKKAFLAAIRANPEDEAPRLVYADWLEERGDTRAEFIRLQADLSRLAPHSDEYAACRVRRNELRQQLDKRWLDALVCVPRHRPLFRQLPATRAARWGLVEEFIEVWHGPLKPKDSCTDEELTAAEERLGVRLPAAVREWQRLGVKRRDIWSVQDHVALSAQMQLDRSGKYLVVRWENQRVEGWGIRREDLDQEDPPIFEIYEGVLSSPTTTAFAIQAILCEIVMRGNTHFHGWVPKEVLRHSLVTQLSKCDVPNRYWLRTPLSIYEGTDLVIAATKNDQVYGTARTNAAMAQLGPEVFKHLNIC
jgi:uncharacterized protein (TIGR02996 family)